MASKSKPRGETKGKEKLREPLPNKKSFSCLVCLEGIIDKSTKTRGQEAVFCDGDTCKGWIHRTCAGLTKAHYDSISTAPAEEPFYCIQCSYNYLSKHISDCKSEIESLKVKLAAVDMKSNTAPSYSQALQSGTDSHEPQSVRQPQYHNRSYDRNFNIVVYGIGESSVGNSRQQRLANDTKEVLEVITITDDTITNQSIRDCVRLGKYIASRNRPILVKLSRTYEVQTILSNRKKLHSKPSISIKPQMSPEEISIEKIILKKRWELIQNGQDRSGIRIRGNSLFVHNAKHGFVQNSTYVLIEATNRDQTNSSTDEVVEVMPPLNSAESPVENSPLASPTNSHNTSLPISSSD